MSLLEARNIHKSYADAGGFLQVLQGINLQINESETLAITGESGCGKSTLLHILGMLDKPDQGEILFKGEHLTINQKKIALFRNQMIGFIFQFHYLLEDFTVVENVAVPMFILTGNWLKSQNRAEELLKEVNLQHRSSYYPNQLSGGEQQRVAIARALINKPEIVLADEPTGNLDPKNSEEVIELLIDLNRAENCSLVVVTHNSDIAVKMGKRYVLEDGNLTHSSL